MLKDQLSIGDPNSEFVGISGNSYNKPIAAVPYFTVDPTRYRQDSPTPFVSSFLEDKVNEQYGKFKVQLDSGAIGAPFVLRGIENQQKGPERYVACICLLYTSPSPRD